MDTMTITHWLEYASEDADRRSLTALKPLLETLARATSSLRMADWNSDATDEVDEPRVPDAR
jgi:hypothetical protein